MKIFAAIAFALLVALCSFASAEIKGEEVSYEHDGVTMKGFIAYDDSIKEKRPGVIVVHEWWGHNKHAREQAKRLAKIGYVGFAIDMYGEGKNTDHPEDAGKFAGEIANNRELAKGRFLAAMKELQAHKMVDAERIGAIGYCFGGSVVIEMALQNVGLDGVASFHGGLDIKSDPQPGTVKTKILVNHGAADKFMTPDQIAAFKKKMDAAGIDYKFVEYEGALHSFTNPDADEMGKKNNMPIAYNAAADQKSWAEMQAFFKKIFGV